MYIMSIIKKRAIQLFLVWLLAFVPVFSVAEHPDMDNGIDPSGGWRSRLGVLSLMLCGDTLSFSYSSVFHSAAHICDSAGVAGLVANNEYHYVDDQGTVAFIVNDEGVNLKLISGSASFCGAEWSGEHFSRDGFEPLEIREVDADKAFFFVVMTSPPDRRKGYVLRGDTLETAPCRHEGSEKYLLARFRGANGGCTAGLIEKDSLQ